MSNVIKANQIRYAEEAKQMDYNEKAQQFTRLFIEGLPVVTEQEPLEESEEGETTPALSEAEMDALLLQKQQEELEQQREALTAEREQLLAEAQQEAERLRAQAETDAERIKDSLCAAARQEGYRDGMELAEQEIEEAKAAFEEQKRSLEEAYEKQVEELEPAFVELVTALVTKLTGVVVEDKREVILHLLHQGMSGAENSRNFIIHVSKEDYEFVASKRRELTEALPGVASLELVEDIALAKTHCMIETDARILDCSLDVQLKGLLTDLKLLAAQ